MNKYLNFSKCRPHPHIRMVMASFALVLFFSLSLYGTTHAGDDVPTDDSVPFIHPGVSSSERLSVRQADASMGALSCGPHYWFDVAGEQGVKDSLLVWLQQNDGTTFSRNPFIGFLGELGEGNDVREWDPETYELVYCVDALATAKGDGTFEYCQADSLTESVVPQWQLAWFMETYPPVIYDLDASDVVECASNGLLCQARVQQAARQLAVWHLIHGFEPYSADPTEGDAVVDAAVLQVYDALLDSIPSQPPIMYTPGPVQLSFLSDSEDSILPGEESETVRIQLTKGDSNPVPLPNVAVNLESSLGTVSPTQSQTDAQGIVTFTVTSETGGTALMTATTSVDVPQAFQYNVPNVRAADAQAQGMTVRQVETVTASANKTWIRTNPKFSIEKRVLTPSVGVASVGTEITYTIDVHNTGDTVLVSIPVTDVYESEFKEYKRNSLGPPDVNKIEPPYGILAWNNILGTSTLDPGQRITFTVTFEALAASESAENIAFADNVLDENGNEADGGLGEDGEGLGGEDSVLIDIKDVTAILLLWFYVGSSDEGNQVHWRTGWEENTWGFHLLRSETAQRSDAVQVTSTLIAPKGNVAESVYSWLDTTAEPGKLYWYWLEEIELGEKVHYYGPVQVNIDSIMAPVFSWNRLYLPGLSTMQ